MNSRIESKARASETSFPSIRPGTNSRQLSGSHATNSSTNANRTTPRYTATDESAIGVKLAQLKSIFDAADSDGQKGLSMEEFHSAMSSTIGKKLSDKDLELLFMKVDANCDETVDWEEFVTYILLEYQEKSLMIEMLKEKPFPKERREIFSRHRDTIIHVSFYPTIRKGCMGRKGIDYGSGRYVTLSKDGTVSFWSLSLKQLRAYHTDHVRERMTPVWMTDMACMSNSNMIAIASTDRDITIYDLTAKKFVRKYHIRGLDHCALCMDYWVNLTNPKDAVLLWGDTGGNVYTLMFQNIQSGGPFGNAHAKQQQCKKITMPELQRGLVPGVKVYRQLGIHDEWVCKVKYIPELSCFISCCQSEEKSMYVGDFENKKTCSYFKVRKGALCFDYCPTNNVIVTGGMDYCIRVWNPYVNNKAIVVLKGHSKPIVHILVNGEKNHCISLDKGKTICIHNLKDQQLLQQISGRAMRMGPVPITAVCFNPKLQTLIVATNHLAVLEKKEEEERFSDVLTHNKTICAALYNRSFQQVVTACEGSTVSVWDLTTGEKVMQFVNAHKSIADGVETPTEITAMSFDAGGRRLLTGAKDGSVKVWNFNNGGCMAEFQVPEAQEVTAVFSAQHRIYVAGWNRQVGVFLEGAGNEEYKAWRAIHKEDILCMDFLSPNIVATGSYDGDIIVWSRETGQIYCKLNAHESRKPIAESNLTNRESQVSLPSSDTLDETESSTDFTSQDSETNSEKWWNAAKTGTGVTSKTDSKSSKETKSDICVTIRERQFSHPLLSAVDVESGKLRLTDGSESSPTIHSRSEYDKICKTFEAAVEKIIFLATRDNDRYTAIILASGAEGWVRAWSIHHQGGLLGQFRAGHLIGDCVHAMVTDDENKYLITGDTSGYIKIWDISTYCIGKPQSDPQRGKNRERFSFLQRNKGEKLLPDIGTKCGDVPTRPPPEATCPNVTIKAPFLVNSYRAHTRSISYVEFVNDRKLILSTSSDCSVRLWTLCGRYIGTFGETWTELPGDISPNQLPRNIPSDLRRVASSTTLKVLNGGTRPHWKLALSIIRLRGLDRIKEQFTHVTTKRQNSAKMETDQTEAKLEKSNILGKSYKRKIRHKMPPTLPHLREVNSTVGVYHTLPFAEMSPLAMGCLLKGLSKSQETRLGATGKQIAQLAYRQVGDRAKTMPNLFHQYETVKNRTVPLDHGLGPPGRIKDTVARNKKRFEDAEKKLHGSTDQTTLDAAGLRTIIE